MFFAIAALLIQPQIAPQISFSAEKAALIQPAISVIASDPAAKENSLPSTSAVADAAAPDTGAEPAADPGVAAPPDAPSPVVEEPVAAGLHAGKTQQAYDGFNRSTGGRKSAQPVDLEGPGNRFEQCGHVRRLVYAPRDHYGGGARTEPHAQALCGQCLALCGNPDWSGADGLCEQKNDVQQA